MQYVARLKSHGCIIFNIALAVNCGNLPNITSGQVMYTTTTYMSTAMYSCATGYDLIGVSLRECTAAGVWSGGEPTCQSEETKNDDINIIKYKPHLGHFNQQLLYIASNN